MSRDITSASITQSKASTQECALLVEMHFVSGVVYMWSGYGSMTWNGLTFLGMGTFGKVEPSTDTSDLSAQGAVFTLEGVTSSLVALAIGDVQQGLSTKMWLGFIVEGALVQDPTLIFAGLTDVCKITESDTTCSISVSCENKLSRLEVVSTRRFTTDDQAIDYPGDLGFDFVPGLQNASITFG